MTELKPCPFCGYNHMEVAWRRSTITLVDDVIAPIYYMIRCRCGAAMLVRMRNYDDDLDYLPIATEASRIATEKWNRRMEE